MAGKLLAYAVMLVTLLYCTVWTIAGMFVGLFFCFGSRILFAHIVALRMGTLVYHTISYFYEWWTGVELVFSGDTLPDRENALLISNHMGYHDWLWILSLATRKGRTGGCLKFFIKKWVQYIPGFGWGLRMTGCIFVERSWERDQVLIRETFRRIRTERLPFWIINFAEGTLLEPEKIALSQAYARKNGLPVLHNCLLPRTKGMEATVMEIADLLDAVYDITIGYERPFSALDTCRGGVNTRVHLHIRRYPIASLPRTGPTIADWLVKRWTEKEALLEQFKKSKSFPPPAHSSPWYCIPVGVTWADTWNEKWYRHLRDTRPKSQ